MSVSNDHAKASDTQFVSSLTDDKCDPELGAKVKAHLRKLHLENTYHCADPKHEHGLAPSYEPKMAFKALQDGVYMAYKMLGLDVENDPSIQDTPKRFAKMFVGELTKGLNYDFFPKCTAQPNGAYIEMPNPAYDLWAQGTRPGLPEPAFKPPKTLKVLGGAYNEMVLIRKIRTTSLCEHHLQTIDGFTHIAYIPGPRIIGLSKLARVTEFFAARPQIQERMTEQIYSALEFILETPDIAVVQDAVHFCMRARGAKQPETATITSKMGGRFMSNPALREEFFHAIK